MDNKSLDEQETVIDTFLEKENTFTYIYDFGDFWEHKVTVEKAVSYTHLDVYKRQVVMPPF